MSPQEWIAILLLGGVAGALGQTARVVVGLKKRNDEASAEGRKLRDSFDGSKLLVSIVIGFTAGALAAVALVDSSAAVTRSHVLGFAAAGYAGADFIEGFMERRLPRPPAPPTGAGT